MTESILVTGAAGFVGAALTRSLRQDGYHVVGVTRDRTRHVTADATVYGDVTDADFCRRVIADYQITTIYHCAAQSIVQTCAEDPVTTLDVNVMGTARLLQAARDAQRSIRVIVSTSDKAYGRAKPPYNEATPFDPHSAYEVSKACQDHVAMLYHRNYDMDIRVVRAVNIYGPGDPNDTRLIPNTILRLQRGELPVVHTNAANMRRQYVYVVDAVEAFRFVADHGSAGEAYCVGSHEPPVSVRDVISAIVEAMGLPPMAAEDTPRDPRFRETVDLMVDGQKLYTLGWSPTTDFHTGLLHTIPYYRQGEMR